MISENINTFTSVSKNLNFIQTNLVRCLSSETTDEKVPFYKRFFKGKTKDAIDQEKEAEEKADDETKLEQEIEMEERELRLQRKRKKSKLHHSHRNILKGEPPQIGLSMNWDETHMTRAYKAQLFGQFGKSNTGIDPSICWPTPEEFKNYIIVANAVIGKIHALRNISPVVQF